MISKSDMLEVADHLECRADNAYMEHDDVVMTPREVHALAMDIVPCRRARGKGIRSSAQVLPEDASQGGADTVPQPAEGARALKEEQREQGERMNMTHKDIAPSTCSSTISGRRR